MNDIFIHSTELFSLKTIHLRTIYFKDFDMFVKDLFLEHL